MTNSQTAVFGVVIAVVLVAISAFYTYVANRDTELYMKYNQAYPHSITAVTQDGVELKLVVVVRGVLPEPRRTEFQQDIRTIAAEINLAGFQSERTAMTLIEDALNVIGYVVLDVWQEATGSSIMCDDNGCRRKRKQPDLTSSSAPPASISWSAPCTTSTSIIGWDIAVYHDDDQTCQ